MDECCLKIRGRVFFIGFIHFAHESTKRPTREAVRGRSVAHDPWLLIIQIYTRWQVSYRPLDSCSFLAIGGTVWRFGRLWPLNVASPTHSLAVGYRITGFRLVMIWPTSAVEWTSTVEYCSVYKMHIVVCVQRTRVSSLWIDSAFNAYHLSVCVASKQGDLL